MGQCFLNGTRNDSHFSQAVTSINLNFQKNELSQHLHLISFIVPPVLFIKVWILLNIPFGLDYTRLKTSLFFTDF